jgi:hypothetical protein
MKTDEAVVNNTGETAAIAGGPQVVCVLGMHRSGTSLATRLLNLLGVYLGRQERLVPANDNNPRGFWEHSGVFRVNKHILSRLGGHSHAPPTMSPDWERRPDLADLRDRAREIIRDNFSGMPLWGWKDPRTCLTLPFWQELIASIDYVLCVRHPLAVARSLRTRDRLPMEQGIRLWLTYVESSLRYTTSRTRMLVMYDDVVSDPLRETRRLARFLGRQELVESSEVQRAVLEFTDDRLRHHDGSGPEADDRVPDHICDLLNRAYETFRQEKESLNLAATEAMLRSALAAMEPSDTVLG